MYRELAKFASSHHQYQVKLESKINLYLKSKQTLNFCFLGKSKRKRAIAYQHYDWNSHFRKVPRYGFRIHIALSCFHSEFLVFFSIHQKEVNKIRLFVSPTIKRTSKAQKVVDVGHINTQLSQCLDLDLNDQKTRRNF